MRSAAGAFDLPSIITGVVVVGVLTAGVLATIFGIIPFAQESGAKQDLASVRTAEAVAFAKEGRFMTTDELYSAGYLTGQPATALGTAGDSASGLERTSGVTPQRPLAVQVGPEKNCYVGVSHANTGKVFYLTDQSAEAKLLEPTTVTGCIDKDALAELTDAIGATTPEMKLPPADVIKASATPVPGYGSSFGHKAVLEGTTTPTRYDFDLRGFSATTGHDVSWAGTNLKAINATAITPGTTGSTWFANIESGPEGLVPGTGYVTATITNKATGETTVQSWRFVVEQKMIQNPLDYKYSNSYRDVPAMTSSTLRFAGSMFADTKTPVPSGRYTAVWTGADVYNATITPSEFAGTSYRERLFIADVVPKAGGLKAGSGNITLTLTNTVTGAVQIRNYALTVNPQADAGMPAVNFTALEPYGQKLAFTLPYAMAGDFTTRWDLDGDINAAMVVGDTGPSIFSATITPKNGGLYPGTAKVTATFKHVASGQEYKRTWDVTVPPFVLKEPSSGSYGTFGDRVTFEMASPPIKYGFSISNSKYVPEAFEVIWTGGTSLNSVAVPAAPGASGSTLNWSLNVTAKTGGFISGTDSITATVRHIPTGAVLTKTMNLTVAPVKIEQANTTPGNSAWADRTIAASATTPVVFGFGVHSSHPSTGYTVSWSGLEEANVTGTPAALKYSGGVNNYTNSFAPKAGGFKAGVYTLTAKVTNNFTGTETVKTWRLTINP